MITTEADNDKRLTWVLNWWYSFPYDVKQRRIDVDATTLFLGYVPAGFTCYVFLKARIIAIHGARFVLSVVTTVLHKSMRVQKFRGLYW